MGDKTFQSIAPTEAGVTSCARRLRVEVASSNFEFKFHAKWRATSYHCFSWTSIQTNFCKHTLYHERQKLVLEFVVGYVNLCNWKVLPSVQHPKFYLSTRSRATGPSGRRGVASCFMLYLNEPSYLTYLHFLCSRRVDLPRQKDQSFVPAFMSIQFHTTKVVRTPKFPFSNCL